VFFDRACGIHHRKKQVSLCCAIKSRTDHHGGNIFSNLRQNHQGIELVNFKINPLLITEMSQLLMRFNSCGLLSCIGMRNTVGTRLGMCAPPKEMLVESFTSLHNNRCNSILSVGARFV
jgi:hypothetical protein